VCKHESPRRGSGTVHRAANTPHSYRRGFFLNAVVRQVKGNASETLSACTVQPSELVINIASVSKQSETLTRNRRLLHLKPENAAGMKARIENLRSRAADLQTRVQTLDRDIERLYGYQFGTRELRRVFRDVSEVYSGAPQERNRRLLNVLIEEVRCSVKRGRKNGDITFKLRGDGSVKREWAEAQKQEDPKPPSSGSSSLRSAWLRERLKTRTSSGLASKQSRIIHKRSFSTIVNLILGNARNEKPRA